MKRMNNIFVTVGTTKFPKLVNVITEVEIIKRLKDLGCSTIQIQTGKNFSKVTLDSKLGNTSVNQISDSWIVKLLDYNITVKYDPYFEKFEDEIRKADLIISHAGAGSCLEVLRLQKPLIIVVNEELMDNHQMELAEQLEKCGHVYSCFCKTLFQTLEKDLNQLIPYPKPDAKLFANYLDKCCGFEK